MYQKIHFKVNIYNYLLLLRLYSHLVTLTQRLLIFLYICIANNIFISNNWLFLLLLWGSLTRNFILFLLYLLFSLSLFHNFILALTHWINTFFIGIINTSTTATYISCLEFFHIFLLNGLINQLHISKLTPLIINIFP